MSKILYQWISFCFLLHACSATVRFLHSCGESKYVQYDEFVGWAYHNSERPRREGKPKGSQSMVTNALRTALVASLALSTDAFIVSSPALAGSRLQRPSASSTLARSARVKTGVLHLQASNFDGAIGQRPDPQVRASYTFSFRISLRAPVP